MLSHRDDAAEVVLLGGAHRGSLGIVIGHSVGGTSAVLDTCTLTVVQVGGHVDVEVKAPALDPPFGHTIAATVKVGA